MGGGRLLISNPDSVLFRYLELRERLESASPREPVAERGLVFAEVCGNEKCAAPSVDARVEEIDDRSKASRWICAECDKPWPVELKSLLWSDFQSSPVRDPTGDLRADLGTFYQILSRLLLREQRIYLLLVLFEGRSYEEAATEANRRWTNFRPPHGQRGPRPARWSKWTIQRVVVDGRRRVNHELRARGFKPRFA